MDYLKYIITADFKLLVGDPNKNHIDIAKEYGLSKDDTRGGGKMFIEDKKVVSYKTSSSTLFDAKEEDFLKAAKNSGYEFDKDCENLG